MNECSSRAAEAAGKGWISGSDIEFVRWPGTSFGRVPLTETLDGAAMGEEENFEHPTSNFEILK